MEYIVIYAKSGYKPRSEYILKINHSGELRYRGKYHVSVPGERILSIDDDRLEEALYLSEMLLSRNRRFYLTDIKDERFRVKFRKNGKVSEFAIDADDVVSADFIDQIITITGVKSLISVPLYIWLLLNKSINRSKEMALVRALDVEQAFELYTKNGLFTSEKNLNDWNVLRIGRMLESGYYSPELYFSFRENQIVNNTPELFLNMGPEIMNFSRLNFYLFVSFGKRFNDPKASYILTLAEDHKNAKSIFHGAFPHVMEKDYQMTDLKSRFTFKGDLFTHHIPLALR